MWCVLHFPIDNSVEVVPSNWVVDGDDGKETFWPNFTGTRLLETITSRESPGCDWQTFQVAVLGEYDDFQKAHLKCNKARETDILSSEVENVELGRGFRTKTKKQLSDYDTDEDTNEPERLSFPQTPFRKKDTGSNLNLKKSIISNATEEKVATVKIHKKRFDGNKTTSNNNAVPVEHTVTTLPTSNQAETTSKMEKDLSEFIAQMKEFQRQVMRQLHIINARLKQQEEYLDVLTKKKDPEIHAEVDEELLELLKLFPLSSLEKLNLIEESLKRETNLANQLAKEFSLVGGDSPKEITKRILYKILTNDLASLYSFEGFKGKKKFKELELYKVIIIAVRYNNKTRDATEKEIINEIKSWLAGAKFRGPRTTGCQ